MLWKSKTEEKRRLKKLASETKNSWFTGAWEKKPGYFIRIYPYSTNGHTKVNEKKYYKTLANRKMRRNQGEDRVSRGGHKKIFDLWWKLF